MDEIFKAIIGFFIGIVVIAISVFSKLYSDRKTAASDRTKQSDSEKRKRENTERIRNSNSNIIRATADTERIIKEIREEKKNNR